MSKTAWITLMFGLLAGGLLAAWAFGWLEPPVSDDPQVAQVQRLRRSIESSREERPEDVEQMRQLMRELSPGQQLEALADLQRQLVETEEERLKAFFALSKEEQLRQLDEEIDRHVRIRNAARGRMAALGRPAGGKRPRPERADVSEKQFIDQTTAEFRAMSTEYHKMLQRRMKERNVR